MALITAAEARDYLPHQEGTTDDTLLDTLIARAESELATYCRFPSVDGAAPTLEQQTLTVYLDGPDALDSRTILLPVRPVVSITSIYDDPDQGYGASYEVTSSNYRLDKTRGRVRLLATSTHAWSESPEAIRVIGVFGFETGSIPAFVKDACGMLVAHKYRLRHTQGYQTATVTGRSETGRDEALPLNIRRLIAPAVMWERAISGASVFGVG